MKEAVSWVVSRVQAPYKLCSEPHFCLITYTVISETLLQVLVTSTQLYIRKLNTGTACPTKSRRVYLYNHDNVICIIPEFFSFFVIYLYHERKYMIFQCTNYQNQLFVYSDIFSALKKWFLPMRWNVERDAGLLGTEEVWTPCDHNTDEMIRYQDILTKTFSQRSIHIYLQFLN